MADEKIRTEWKSEKPVPDEDFLKKEFEAEVATLSSALAKGREHSQRLHGSREHLIKASGLNDGQIKKLADDAKSEAKKAMDVVERELAKPAVDIEALHQQDLALVKQNAEQAGTSGNPSWSGLITTPDNGGSWSSVNGEAEEAPSSAWSTVTEKIDPRSQAYGEGWFDGDHSTIHAYLTFTFRPPSWGSLRVYAAPRFHGYYQLYSNDEWYNSEYARAELDSWIQLHQSFWRPRGYARRFTMGGDELHPTRYGRIDTIYGHNYYTSVGATDQVTIRVGARLHSYARAGGSLSRLNFQSGDANFINIPYVYWSLHHS